MEDIASVRTQTTETMTGLLAAIAGVSLLVGGIGIMNIMLVSVTATAISSATGVVPRPRDRPDAALEFELEPVIGQPFVPAVLHADGAAANGGALRSDMRRYVSGAF